MEFGKKQHVRKTLTPFARGPDSNNSRKWGLKENVGRFLCLLGNSSFPIWEPSGPVHCLTHIPTHSGAFQQAKMGLCSFFCVAGPFVSLLATASPPFILPAFFRAWELSGQALCGCPFAWFRVPHVQARIH